jgi:SAM-dependent methyltransferase
MMTTTNDWFDKDAAGFPLDWCPVKDRGFMNELVLQEAAMIDTDKDGPSWAYRPYPISTLGQVLAALNLVKPLTSFLEVGCGPGTKLLMVDRIFKGARVSGFDYNAQYIMAARDLIKAYGRQDEIVAFQERAELFQRYGFYQYIYINRPLWEQEAALALEVEIEDQMHPGSVLILANAVNKPPWKVLAEATALVAYEVPRRTS